MGYGAEDCGNGSVVAAFPYSSRRRRSCALREDDVRGVRRRNMLGALIAELWRVDTGEEVLSGAEKDRGNGQVHFVDEPGPQVLLNGRDASADPNVFAARRFGCALQCCLDSVTKWKVVPPCMLMGSRGWWVSTKTGVW